VCEIRAPASGYEGTDNGWSGVKVESDVDTNVRTGIALDKVTIGWDGRNARSGVQRPVQFHLLIEGEIEEARLRSAWQERSGKQRKASSLAEA
jgi:hypothetical protein